MDLIRQFAEKETLSREDVKSELRISFEKQASGWCTLCAETKNKTQMPSSHVKIESSCVFGGLDVRHWY